MQKYFRHLLFLLPLSFSLHTFLWACGIPHEPWRFFLELFYSTSYNYLIKTCLISLNLGNCTEVSCLSLACHVTIATSDAGLGFGQSLLDMYSIVAEKRELELQIMVYSYIHTYIPLLQL